MQIPIFCTGSMRLQRIARTLTTDSFHGRVEQVKEVCSKKHSEVAQRLARSLAKLIAIVTGFILSYFVSFAPLLVIFGGSRFRFIIAALRRGCR